MKKFFIAALFAASVFSSAFAAGTNKVSNMALRTFQTEFGNATNVEWTVKSSFTKASFLKDGQNTEAFFDTDGNLIGSSRAITIDQLPTDAKRSFAKKYPNYTINEAIRFDDNEKTSFYLSAENEKESVVLRVTGGFLYIFKSVKK